MWLELVAMLVNGNMLATKDSWEWKIGRNLHYSSTPYHRRFEMSITAGLGGVGFKSLVIGGVITAGFKTGSDKRAQDRRFINRW